MTAYESIALNAADAAHDSGHRFDADRRWAATLALAFETRQEQGAHVTRMTHAPGSRVRCGYSDRSTRKAKPAAATCTYCTRPAAWSAAMP